MLFNAEYRKMFASQFVQEDDGDDYIYVPVEDNPNLEYRIKRVAPVDDDPPKRQVLIANGVSDDEDSEADTPISKAKNVKTARVLGQDAHKMLPQMHHADGSPVKESTARKALFVAKERGEEPPKIVEDVEVEKDFKALVQPNVVRALEEIDQLEQRVVIKMEEVLKSLMQQALQPVYLFIGSLEAVATAQTTHYQHYYGFQMGCKSLFDFKLKNRHLGDNILFVAAEYARKLAGVKEIDKSDVKFIGMRYPLLSIDQKERIRGDFDLDKDGAPEWIWCMIGKPCIRFMLKNHTFGPISMAAQELGYPEVKPLLDSQQVSYMFAQFVAHKFFQGPNVQLAGAQGGQMQYRISSGILKTQAMNKWLMGCRLWFKQVYWGTNAKRADDLEDARKHLEAAQVRFDANQNNRDAEADLLVAEREMFLAKCQPERLLCHPGDS